MAVHVVKVTHTHENSTSKTARTGNTKIAKLTAPCAICDYEFAKNKDFYFQEIIVPALPAHTGYYVRSTRRPANSIGLASSDRGPPSSI